MLTKAQGVLLAAVVLSGALAGCASTPPEPQPTPSDTAAPFFEPLAGGRCDDLLDPADVAVALGGSVTANAVLTGVELPQLAAVGGLGCVWVFGDEGAPDSTSAVLHVVPADIAEPGEIDNAAANVCETSDDLTESNAGCLVDTYSSGWWYELRVSTSTTAQQQSDSLRAVDSLVQQAIAQATPSQRIDALPVVDCAAAVNGATSSQTPLTADAGALALAADRLARPTDCGFSVAGDPWGGASVFPRSTVDYDQCVERAGAEVDLPGIAHAYTPEIDGPLLLCVSDGTSSLTIIGPLRGSWDAWTDSQLADAAKVGASLLAVASG